MPVATGLVSPEELNAADEVFAASTAGDASTA